MVSVELTLCEFMDLFKNENGELEGWSYEGLEALFNYLEELEEETGIRIEADVIAINSEWQEYKNIDEYLDDYDSDIKREDYETEEEIRDKTQLIKISDDLNDGFIVGLY